MTHTPEQVIRYALNEALSALDGCDWEDLLGQLDVAQSWVPRAQAHEAEHAVPRDWPPKGPDGYCLRCAAETCRALGCFAERGS